MLPPLSYYSNNIDIWCKHPSQTCNHDFHYSSSFGRDDPILNSPTFNGPQIPSYASQWPPSFDTLQSSSSVQISGGDGEESINSKNTMDMQRSCVKGSEEEFLPSLVHGHFTSDICSPDELENFQRNSISSGEGKAAEFEAKGLNPHIENYRRYFQRNSETDNQVTKIYDEAAVDEAQSVELSASSSLSYPTYKCCRNPNEEDNEFRNRTSVAAGGNFVEFRNRTSVAAGGNFVEFRNRTSVAAGGNFVKTANLLNRDDISTAGMSRDRALLTQPHWYCNEDGTDQQSSELADSDSDDQQQQQQQQQSERQEAISHNSNSVMSKRFSRSLIKPTQITVNTLLNLMPSVIHQFPCLSRIGLCRKLKGKLYTNSPQPSPNFIINTLIPVFLAADNLGFPWHLHSCNSLAFVKSWIFNHPSGKQLLNRVRIDYHAPTSAFSAHGNSSRYYDSDDYYSYCMNTGPTSTIHN